ncbi:hypothetical protein D4R99_04945 [bacterium]|nr:MAG: hypothetical protein D4R99_04945 [bacterium]
MFGSEGLRKKYPYQEPLVKLPEYFFRNGATIRCVYGRCETEGVLVGTQLNEKSCGQHFYIALNNVIVYSFKFQGRRTLSTGQRFRTGGGKRK